MGPAKPHTPHMSLSSGPFSPLGDDHHICCHPGISLLPQDKILPDTTHGQSHLVLRALEQSRSFSLCWKHPPHTPATHRHFHHRHDAPLWVRKRGLVTRALLWGTQNMFSGWLTGAPIPGRQPWNLARQKSEASLSSQKAEKHLGPFEDLDSFPGIVNVFKNYWG